MVELRCPMLHLVYFVLPRSSCLACLSASAHLTSQASIAHTLEYSEWHQEHVYLGIVAPESDLYVW